MTKSEFMRELASLLSRIPEDERDDALQYYEDYFADAGITDETLVPNSIGTPKQVADKIIRQAIYGEEPEQVSDNLKDVPARKNSSKRERYYEKSNDKNTYHNSGAQYENSSNTSSSKGSDTDNTKLILGIILIIVTFPVWIGIVAGIGGLLIGILAAFVGMIICFGVAGIALIVTAFLSSSLAGGILLMGTGMLLLALAVILVIPFVMFCGRFLPWLVREIGNLVNRLLGKKEYIS